jgi:hypothetical protein
MSGKNSISLRTMALVLLSGSRLLADPFMSSLQVGPQSPDPVSPGGTASYTITITKTNNGSMVINLSALGLPPGAKASFSPNPLNFANNTASKTATLIISTTNSIPAGSYPFNISAQDGGSHNTLTNSATLDLGLRPPSLALMTNGCWCFNFGTLPGRTYLVQATTSLSIPSWTTLCTTNAGTNNLLMFVDADKTSYSSRFYRAVAQ